MIAKLKRRKFITLAPPPSTSAIVMLRPFSSFDYATKIFCQSPEPVEHPARVAHKLP
jgi:hypothetical protein